MTQLTWLVTGCSSGIGEQFVRSILARGDKAIATSRGGAHRLQSLKDAGALVYELDVSSPRDVVVETIQNIIKEVGGLDVLVNNAAYASMGLVEEVSDSGLLECFSTNFLGSLHTTQAVLPHFRSKKSGTIVSISSISGIVGNYNMMVYNASKFALEAMHDCLLLEAASLGIRPLIFELGYYATNGPAKVKYLDSIHSVESGSGGYPSHQERSEMFKELIGSAKPGDVEKAVNAMIDLVKEEGIVESHKGQKLPNRLPLGRDSLFMMRQRCLETLQDCHAWEDLITSPSV